MNHPISSLTDSRFLLPGDKRVPCKFYSVEGKLLLTSASFIGLEPQVVPLPFPAAENGKELSKDLEVTHEGQPYTLQLTTALYSGPLSGWHRLNVMRNGSSLLRYKWGGALGGNYTKGVNGFIEGEQAILYLHSPEIARFYGEKEGHFLLLFRGIVYPQQRKETDGGSRRTTITWQGKIRSGAEWIHVRHTDTRQPATRYSVREGGVLEDQQGSSVHTEEEVVLGNEFLEEE